LALIEEEKSAVRERVDWAESIFREIGDAITAKVNSILLREGVGLRRKDRAFEGKLKDAAFGIAVVVASEVVRQKKN